MVQASTTWGHGHHPGSGSQATSTRAQTTGNHRLSQLHATSERGAHHGSHKAANHRDPASLSRCREQRLGLRDVGDKNPPSCRGCCCFLRSPRPPPGSLWPCQGSRPEARAPSGRPWTSQVGSALFLLQAWSGKKIRGFFSLPCLKRRCSSAPGGSTPPTSRTG